MELFTLLNELLSHFNEWLSIKFLAFITFFSLVLDSIAYFTLLRDKLNPMYDSIVPYLYWAYVVAGSCFAFKLLCCFASFLKHIFIAHQQKKHILALQKETLQNLLALPLDERLILKYLFYKNSHSAFLNHNDLAVCNLERNGYIKHVFDASKKFEDFNSSLDIIFLHAFYIPDNILLVMQLYQNEILLSWQNLHSKKKFKLFEHYQR